MKTKTHTSRALQATMYACKMTQADIAERAQLNQTTISNIIIGRRARPDVPTLRALCAPHVWVGDRCAALSILLGHLHDEVERAGYPDGTIKMRADGQPGPAINTADMIRTIGEHNPTLGAHLAAIVHSLYDVIRAEDEPARMVAERSEKYTPRKKRRPPRKKS